MCQSLQSCACRLQPRVARYVELVELHRVGMSEYERCLWRSDSLTSAKRACEQAQGWCGGVVRDNGIYCSVRS